MGNKSFRSFIAIPLPNDQKQEIWQFQKQLHKLDLPLSWENPDKLHITLHFLGKVDPSAISKLGNSLRDPLNSYVPFVLTPTNLGYFYKKHTDSIVFLEVSPDKDLKELEKLVRAVLLDQGFSPPYRFYPHINIARLKRLRHPNQVKQVLTSVTDHPAPKFSTFPVNSISIFESNFSPHDNTSQYHLYSTIEFGNHPPKQ